MTVSGSIPLPDRKFRGQALSGLGSVVTEMALEAEIHNGVKYIVGTRLPEDPFFFLRVA